MKKISTTVQRTFRYERGLVTTEYMLTGILVTLIALVLIPNIPSAVVDYVARMSVSLGSIGFY